MSLLQADLTDKIRWFRVYSVSEGTHYLPARGCTADEALCAFNDEDPEIEEVWGYGVRAVAPGYLDCTEWVVYTRQREALKAYRALDHELRADRS